MLLRGAGAVDAAKLSLIGGATFIESFANDHDGDEVVRYLASDHAPEWYARQLADPAKRAWLLEEAVGCPVGYAMAVPATLPGTHASTDYELKRIYVLSKWHGRGWGSKLFQAAEDEARARGARRLVLSVYVENLSAQKFYAARGFETIGRWVFDGFAASEDFIVAKML
jgi:diamine N-acetyltransferase